MKSVKSTFLFHIVLLISIIGGGDNLDGAVLPNSTDTVSYHVLGRENLDDITIIDTIDLKGSVCNIPAGKTLIIKGGYIKNGTLVGKMTKLKSCSPCFNHVRIHGSWDVPVIKSTLFDDLNYNNALKDVIALSHPSISNKILIKEGRYSVSALGNNDVCLLINSNTELVLDGVIKLVPNDYRCYNIVQIQGENIKIRGNGTIIGDKHSHKGNDGEWGMGINVKYSHDVRISDIAVKNCWGDCIYVGDHSSKVIIENCMLDHGRRQGISVTSANGVLIKDCEITNISGTLPEFAIDVEPNENDSVDNVVIDNVRVTNCKGGIKAVRYAKNTKIGSIMVRNCSISSDTHDVLKLVRCEKVTIEKNYLKRLNNRRVIECVYVNQLAIIGNSFVNYDVKLKGLRSRFKNFIFGDSNDEVKIVSCVNVICKNNMGLKKL